MRRGPETLSRSAAVLATLAVFGAARRTQAESRYQPDVFGRLTAEASAVAWPVRYHIRGSAPGAALSSPVDTYDQRAMLGARAELALLFVTAARRALGPRLAYSLAAPAVARRWTLVTEVDRYAIEERPWLHVASVGFELQTFERHLVLVADLGGAHAVNRGTFQGAGLHGRFSHASTWALFRLGVGGRWPLGDALALTVIPQLECGVDIPPLLRGVISAGLDFGGRRRR